MAKKIVLATAPVDSYCEKILSQFGEIRIVPDIKVETIRASMKDVVALVVRGAAPIERSVIEAATDLKVIGRTGVGYDSVDITAATDHGIPVVFTPGVGARAVAEAAIGFMLAMCKKIHYWDKELKRGNWKSRYDSQNGDLDEKTLGILGFGRIGQLVADMAKPFNMTILACDPYFDADVAKSMGVTLTSIEDLLRRSDFVSLHCPQTEETAGLINAERLGWMKQGSYLINLARGGVIESNDVLAEALDSGRLAGVALDVFDPAPPDTSHPLFANPNCLTSPHSMATSAGAMNRIFRSMTNDMAAILKGETPNFVVNPETLPTDGARQSA